LVAISILAFQQNFFSFFNLLLQKLTKFLDFFLSQTGFGLKKLDGKSKIKGWNFFKLSCDSRFQRAFTACVCVFKVITLVWANQGNFFKNETTCSKRTLKTTNSTQLNKQLQRATSLTNDNYIFLLFTSRNYITGFLNIFRPTPMRNKLLICNFFRF